jgi:hypothetical protein
MFLKSAVSLTGFFLASAILLLATPQSGLSQDPSGDDTTQIINDDAIDALDEIVVYGEPTLRLLRDEVWQAEDNFYELFNALNKGRQFDVTCTLRKPFGSQIARRVCEPFFVNSSPTAGMIDIGGPPHWVYMRHKSRQMEREMVALIDEHPDLYAALSEYVDAKQAFHSSFRNRCDNRTSNCQK